MNSLRGKKIQKNLDQSNDLNFLKTMLENENFSSDVPDIFSKMLGKLPFDEALQIANESQYPKIKSLLDSLQTVHILQSQASVVQSSIFLPPTSPSLAFPKETTSDRDLSTHFIDKNH